MRLLAAVAALLVLAIGCAGDEPTPSADCGGVEVGYAGAAPSGNEPSRHHKCSDPAPANGWNFAGNQKCHDECNDTWGENSSHADVCRENCNAGCCNVADLHCPPGWRP